MDDEKQTSNRKDRMTRTQLIEKLSNYSIELNDILGRISLLEKKIDNTIAELNTFDKE